MMDPKAWLLGVIFRTMTMLWLLMTGMGITNTHINEWDEVGVSTKITYIIIKIVGAILIFLSFYLFLNLYNKKVSEERYGQWSVAAFAIFVILPILGLIPYITSSFTDTETFSLLKNIIFIAF